MSCLTSFSVFPLKPLPLSAPTLKNLWGAYNFMDAMVPHDLKLRGVDGPLLRDYDYARDSLRIWNAVRDYTKGVLTDAYQK